MVEIITAALSIFLTAIVNKVFGKDKTQLDSASKRLYNAYLPMFKIVEPYLYKDLNNDQALFVSTKLNEVIEEEFLLVDPHLTSSIRDFSKGLENGKYKSDTFERICYKIDTDYERLKKLLYLPRRDLFYRYYNGQLSREADRNLKENLDLLKNFFAKLLLFLIFIFIYYILMYLWSFIKVLIW